VSEILSEWFVYVVECVDGTYYTGITTNLDRRIHEHNKTNRGAKYVKGRRPCRLVYHRSWSGRSEAAKEEYRIKKLTRGEKENIIKRFQKNSS